MKRSLPLALAIAGIWACTAGVGIGGPIDKRYPPERRVLKEESGVRVVAMVDHVHYAGEKAGCTTQSEIGCGSKGASPGDEFILDVRVEVPGREALVSNRPFPAGIGLVSRHRIASAESLEGWMKQVQIETCSVGKRAAVRARLDDSEQWAVIDFAGERWAVYNFHEPCAAVAEKGIPVAWNELVPEKKP